MTELTSNTDVAIAVITYNSEADIEACIRSLGTHFPLLKQGRAEAHVVDNASSDATPKILYNLKEEFEWLKLHFPDDNLGFGPGNNLVLNSVSAKAYVLLNADAWLIADSFSPAIEYITLHPETGIIGLPLIYPDGSPQTYAFLPSAWHRWLLLILGFRRIAEALLRFAPTRSLMLLVPFSRNFVVNHSKPRFSLNDASSIMASSTRKVRSVAWVAGAAMILSRSFVSASGGFDPRIFLYGEDEDLCIQARNLGFAVETLQTAPIVHKLGWGGSRRFNPQVARLKYVSLRYFISKNIHGPINRTMMRVLLPLYVYGRNLGHFFRGLD